MKRLTLHRLASALLCLTLALSLTACGGKKKPAPAAGNGGVKETISDSRTDQTGQADPVKPSEPEAEVDQELVEECLDKLHERDRPSHLFPRWESGFGLCFSHVFQKIF